MGDSLSRRQPLAAAAVPAILRARQAAGDKPNLSFVGTRFRAARNNIRPDTSVKTMMEFGLRAKNDAMSASGVTRILLLFAAGIVWAQQPVTYGYKVVNSYPHDPDAYTQGLVYHNGFLYEGTGQNGRSSIRKVELQTGKVLQQNPLPGEYFGEGIALWKGKLIQLTWHSRIGFVYDLASFKMLSTFIYKMEGWGLTQDGKRLILSDGTANLHFFDPETWKEAGKLAVTDRGAPLPNLNELEFIKGEIWANVWQTDRIARISPATGRVTAWVDLKGIQPPTSRQIDVLNGIAYDAKTDRIFVTGKWWPKLYEIRMVAK